MTWSENVLSSYHILICTVIILPPPPTKKKKQLQDVQIQRTKIVKLEKKNYVSSELFQTGSSCETEVDFI